MITSQNGQRVLANSSSFASWGRDLHPWCKNPTNRDIVFAGSPDLGVTDFGDGTYSILWQNYQVNGSGSFHVYYFGTLDLTTANEWLSILQGARSFGAYGGLTGGEFFNQIVRRHLRLVDVIR